MVFGASRRQFKPHRHDELEVNLVLNGRGRYLLDDRTYNLTRCTQIWLFPEQNHVLLDVSADFEMWVLVFKPALVERTCTSQSTRPLCARLPAVSYCKQLSEERTRRLHALFHEVNRSADEDPARHNAGLAYAMLSAWDAQRATEAVPAGTDLHPAVDRAVRLLRFETDPLNLPTLARQTGLSASRLSRLFLQQTGLSVTAFRNRQRLERFLTLTVSGARPKMLEAALDAGFGSYPQFHRVFKELMGCSPREYRRRG